MKKRRVLTDLWMAAATLLLSLPLQSNHAGEPPTPPSMSVTVSALDDAVYWVHIGGPADDKIMIRKTAIQVKHSSHDCKTVRYTVAAGESDHNYNGSIEYDFSPLSGDLTTEKRYADGQLETWALFRCATGDCIHYTVNWYRKEEPMSGTLIVEDFVLRSMALDLSEPNLHRYVNAFHNLQRLCGGAQKNPFD